MNKFFRHSLIIVSTLYAGSVFCSTATYDVKDIPQLAQQEQHAKVVKRVSDLYGHSHYKFIPLDDALSKKIFDRYIDQLDSNKLIFLQSDIDKLQAYQYSFDDNLKSRNVEPAYAIYQLNLQRRFERYSYALSLLETEIKFIEKDSFQYDRSEAQWPTTQAEINKIWQQRVKYDALSLKLTGKEWPAIKERLTKRYTSAIKHLVQTESEDVFQVFMNAYSHVIEPHTSYLSPRNAKRFKMEMNLSLEGIGAVLQLVDDYTVVRSLVPGGPAERSKLISPEDKIIGVGQDGKKIVDIIGWRLDDIVDLIKGPKGTTVQLQIESGKAGDTNRTIEIVREKIHLEDREAKSSVEQIDGKKIGVITIPSFYVNLSDDIDKAITTLKKDNVEGIVIDLRNNGGGSLPEATLSTGLFIGEGPVVQVRNSRNETDVNRDSNKNISYDGPLTVLVNRYSASASEIFAAALQDYGRAIIIGEQTFGKGTVQQHRSLSRFYDDDKDLIGFVQYTIAKFYRIDGGSTQHKGVIPDILFQTATNHEDTGESLEKNALPWDNIKSADYKIYADLSDEIKELTKLHSERIKKEVEFAYIAEDIKEIIADKEVTSVSLVESERIKIREAEEAAMLARTNERLTRAGLANVKSIDDLPDDYEPLDTFLLEAVAITLDYSKI